MSKKLVSLSNQVSGRLFLIALVLISIAAPEALALAGSATLTWTPPTTYANGLPLVVAGYKIYTGTVSEQYGSPINAGALTGNPVSYTVNNLGIGTFYFAVTAYDAGGVESKFSNEVSKTFTAPVISAVASTAVTSSTASITWTTSVAASTQIFYGTTAAYGASTAINSSLTTNHIQTISGLQSSTTYHFSVQSIDASGDVSTSGDNIFTTAAVRIPPVLSGIAAGNITPTSAVITWTTNVLSTTEVFYGTTSAYGSSTPLNSSLLTSHSATLTGLQASTTYHYNVQSADSAGDLSISGDLVFTTPAASTPTGPLISGVIANNPTSSSAVVTWTTDVASTSQVVYGTTTAYGSLTTLDASLVTSHSQTLSGLQPSTTYHYSVESADAAGHQSTSADYLLTTSAAPPAPVISSILAGGITSSSAVVTWTTDVASTSQIAYGTTTAYGSLTTINTSAVTAHSQTIVGLQPGTTYHFQVLSGVQGGGLSSSPDQTLATASATNGPVIGSVDPAYVASSGIIVTWSTDVASTSQVEYGPTAAYGSLTPLSSILSTHHAEAVSNLQPSTTYHYRVRSANASGVLSMSGDNTVTTSASGGGPQISNVGVEISVPTAVLIGWTTATASTSQIAYGTTSAYGSITTLTSSLVLLHFQVLSGLQPLTTYHYQVLSVDGSGNWSISGDRTFTTP